MEENLYKKLISAYASGELEGKALSDFEQQLAQDTDLQNEVNVYFVLKALENQKLKKGLLALQQREQLQPLVPKTPKIRFLQARWLALAAVFLGILLSVWYWLKPVEPNTLQLAETYLSKPYPPPVQTMGQDTQTAQLSAAYHAYRQGNFTSASQQLAALATDAQASDELLFYTGESMLQTQQLQTALSYFDRVKNQPWRNAADWRSALSLIKMGQQGKAKAILEKLQQTERKQDAEKLMKGL